MHGNSMIFDPLFSEKSIQNQVKNFLNQSVMMGAQQRLNSTTSFDGTSTSFMSNLKRKSPYRFKTSAESSMSLSQFGENSNIKVKRLLSQKLNRGVAVNPYYAGILQKVSRGSSRQGFSSTQSVINISRRGTNNSSPTPKFNGNNTVILNHTNRGGLASILDMPPAQKKKQKIRIYSTKTTRSNIKNRKVSSNQKPKTANPGKRNNYQLLDTNNHNSTSQDTSATTALKSGDILSSRMNEDSQGIHSDSEKFQISKVVSQYSTDFPPQKIHSQIPEEENPFDEQKSTNNNNNNNNRLNEDDDDQGKSSSGGIQLSYQSEKED